MRPRKSASAKFKQAEKSLIHDSESESSCEEESVSLASSAGESDTQRVVVKYENVTKRFSNDFILALSAAAYVTIFGLPVYSAHMSWVIFGERERLVDGELVTECAPDMMGWMVNIGNASHPSLVSYNSTFSGGTQGAEVWCGYLPASYFANWPLIVQTAVFTIFGNAGSTVKLAWQCMAGTFVAILNIYFLNCIFPGGAAGDSYNPVVAWLDFIVVLFLLLASTAEVNTVRIGMSWTVCFMMNFMNPEIGVPLGAHQTFLPYINWDGELTVAMLTSFMGCLLSILATIFPMPLLNISRVHDDAAEVTNAIIDIYEECIGYWAGADKGPKRFRIFAKIEALASAGKRVEQNLEFSWWETFNLNESGRVLKLYSSLNKAIQMSSNELYLGQSALETISFGPSHKKFVSEVRTPLQALAKAATECLRMCARFCRDGRITPDEESELLQQVEVIESMQHELSMQYQLAQRDQPYVSADLAADYLLVFSVSCWATQIADFGRDLAAFENHWEASGYSNPCKGLVRTALHHLKRLLDPKDMFRQSKLQHALSDGLPIVVTFALAMYMNSPVITPLSSTMPGTLCWLVATENDYGFTFARNAKRLIGVIFGKTLSLLIMSCIGTLPYESNERFTVHLLSLFVFNFVALLVCYNSDSYSYIGQLIAGFGCFPMFAMRGGQEAINHKAEYHTICEVIIAILLRMLISRLVARREPRHHVVDNLKKLTKAVKGAYMDFLVTGEGGLEAHRNLVKKYLDRCEAILPKCDPTMQVLRGWHTPFKVDLLGSALAQFRLVLSDLDTLVLAMTVPGETPSIQAEEHHEESLFKLMIRQSAWQTMVDDLVSTIEGVCEMLTLVLTHNKEEPLEDEAIDRILCHDRILELDGLREFYEEVALAEKRYDKDDDIFKDERFVTQLRRTRLAVTIHALSLSIRHFGHISAACFNHMVYY